MYRILIIDDDLRIRQTAQISLEIVAGWETFVAASGEEGLIIAAKEQPDAILLDVRMPGMDGITTLKYLQSNFETQSIPVILFTSAAELFNQEQSTQLPVAGIINKPFEATELVEKIRMFLDRSV